MFHTLKCAEFVEYVQVGPGRTTSRVTAENCVTLELCPSPAGVLINGVVLVPLTNVRYIELVDAGSLGGKAEEMLAPAKAAEEAMTLPSVSAPKGRRKV